MPLFALLISSALGPRATTAALGLVLPSSNSMPACLPYQLMAQRHMAKGRAA
jgi:hypothetical protein